MSEAYQINTRAAAPVWQKTPRTEPRFFGDRCLQGIDSYLDIGCSHLRRWMHRNGVHWRRSPLHGYYIIWADADEQKRLQKLQAYFNAHPSMNTAMYPKELTRPKRRLSTDK
jgi:hypothetical protein